MGRRCEICGKKAIRGNSIVRRGLAKKKKGVGKKTTGITKRKFFPNLQTKRVVVKGEVKKMLICTKCLKKTEPLFPGKV